MEGAILPETAPTSVTCSRLPTPTPEIAEAERGVHGHRQPPGWASTPPGRRASGPAGGAPASPSLRKTTRSRLEPAGASEAGKGSRRAPTLTVKPRGRAKPQVKTWSRSPQTEPEAPPPTPPGRPLPRSSACTSTPLPHPHTPETKQTKQNSRRDTNLRERERPSERKLQSRAGETRGAGAAPYARWPPPLGFPRQSRGLAPGIVGIEVQRSPPC